MAISDPGSDSSHPIPDGGDGAVPEATATEAAAAAETDPTATDWRRRYLREHVAHLLVVATLAVYPAVYFLLTHSPLAAEAEAVLPRIETMVAVMYFGLFAMSFDFVSGYTGYLSFGHAAFYGLGAYVVLLAAKGKVPFVPAGTPLIVLLVLAGLLAVALAVAVGAVSFRLTGVYFAMITLGVSQVVYVLFANWGYVSESPRDGLAVRDAFSLGVPYVDALSLDIGGLVGDELALGPVVLEPTAVSYYMIGLVVLVCYLAMQRVIHSPFGRVMIAIRENEERARAVGYDTVRYKLGAFAISAFFAAVAGGLLAGFERSVGPDGTFHFLVAGDALLATIIGGFGTLAGPLFGRLFHEGITEFLSKGGSGGGLLPYLREHLGDGVMGTGLPGGMTVGEFIEVFLNGRASLYVGLAFVLFVLYAPDGLLGTVRARLEGRVAKRLPDWLERRLRGWR